MSHERLYQERLARYVTAMRNETPDRVPIRPFVAEFTARYAGITCQEVTHDYRKAFDAAVRCAKDFDWDAVVPNMVYVWTGLTQAAGLRYYLAPGIGLPVDGCFSYLEPPADQAFMRADEYDALIADPTRFLFHTWLPRVSSDVAAPGTPASYRGHLALVKSSMAMMEYFQAFGPQVDRLRLECGMPSAIAGIFKAPFDIIADKLRGYLGLVEDMARQPAKVLAACEALMPHLCRMGLTTADPGRRVPIGFWMHRGCAPFFSPTQFGSHYWPTLRPIIEEFWKQGHQTLFYAEGKWAAHLDAFRELPPGSIVFHVDRDDVFAVKRKLGDRFAISGGVPNVLLGFGRPGEVRDFCRRVIDEVACDGGYIMDAGAIMQNDTSVENLRVLTETTREFGVYPGAPAPTATPPCALPDSVADRAALRGLAGRRAPPVPAGVCIPWSEKMTELPPIAGDEDLVRSVWERVDALGNDYIWQLLLSF
jgi:hypothetical protein